MPRAGKGDPAGGAAVQALLRALPSVDVLIQALASDPALAGVPRPRLAASVRETLAAERRRLLEAGGPATDAATLGRHVKDAITRGGLFSLAPVINATGVVLHTNLGRALLSPLAQERLREVAASYSNLEMDVARKERGSRYSHVDGLLRRLSGAEAALVVNNCASAVLLALESLARGKEVVVSRGELIEIGGEFRIPDILRRSGATLREVGTTNRTHLKDYAGAIGPDTGVLLKVHTSNYRVVGFTAAVSSRELAELGRARGIPVMEDLGSGCFVDLTRHGFPYEPTVPEVVASGVDLVSFSGDKLLGGPQAGLMVGRKTFIERIAKNPLKRALRLDKVRLAALEATLRLYADPEKLVKRLPTLRALARPAGEIHIQAERLLPALANALGGGWQIGIKPVRGQIGSGALPVDLLPSFALSVKGRGLDKLAEAFRHLPIPVIGRIQDETLLFDLRTLDDEPAFAAQLPKLAP